MGNGRETVRKTVNLDKTLVEECLILMGKAGAQSFSEYVSNALSEYNAWKRSGQENTALTKQMIAALRHELRPIESRVSKGLYRYALYLDVLCQVFATTDDEFGNDVVREFFEHAKRRVSKTRGKLDLDLLMGVKYHDLPKGDSEDDSNDDDSVGGRSVPKEWRGFEEIRDEDFDDVDISEEMPFKFW